MITESQREKFKSNLENFFDIIEKELNGETVEDTETIETWFRNVYLRYNNSLLGTNPKHQLPKEHLETLTKKIEEKGLTLEDIKESYGRKIKFIEIIKNKQKKEKNKEKDEKQIKTSNNKKSLEEYSIEELKKLQEEYDKEIISLDQKHSLRYKKLYNLSDEKFEEIGKRLDLSKRSRKRINEIIENKIKSTETLLEVEEDIEIIEIPEVEEKVEIIEEQKETKTRKQKKANEKITELMKEKELKEEKIEELTNELEKIKQQRQDVILDYQGKYEKRLEEKTKELEENMNIELERKTSMLEIESKREVKEVKAQLEQAKAELEQFKSQQDKELEKRMKMITNQIKDVKERQQQIMVKLLCSSENISLDTIRRHLENEKIPTEGLENSLKELRNMIPGITRVIKDEETANFSLRMDALKRAEEYKNDIICPRISNVRDGKIEFIVRADLHLNMTNSEDTLKRQLEPFMNYCVKRNNIPIIDLGDLAETIVGIKYRSWRDFDKETAKLAYKFYKNYAKAIQSAPEIKHYTLLGNHDEHPYLVGVDPLEILSEYSDNFKPLGISRGAFKIGNDKIGVFHDKQWQNIVSYQEFSKEERDEQIYEYLCNEAETIAKDYIYSLFGHYHFGAHNIEKSFSVINNGLDNSLLFTAEVKDGYIEKMFVTEVKKGDYKIEIYNRGNQYRK